MPKRITWGWSGMAYPEEVPHHLGYFCTGCGDTVTSPKDQCQGGCLSIEDLHSPYLFCVVCGNTVPPEEMNKAGVCCSCYEQIHLLHSDEY